MTRESKISSDSSSSDETSQSSSSFVTESEVDEGQTAGPSDHFLKENSDVIVSENDLLYNRLKGEIAQFRTAIA